MSILYIIICINLFQYVFFQIVSVWYRCGICNVSSVFLLHWMDVILHLDICEVSGEVGGVVCGIVSDLVFGVVREFRRMRLV